MNRLEEIHDELTHSGILADMDGDGESIEICIGGKGLAWLKPAKKIFGKNLVLEVIPISDDGSVSGAVINKLIRNDLSAAELATYIKQSLDELI